MSHSILSLISDQFNARILLAGNECVINIDGETVSCRVEVNKENFVSPTYSVFSADSGKELCTFRPYHLHEGPVLYQIEGVSMSGGDATLIVPTAKAVGLADDVEEDEIA